MDMVYDTIHNIVVKNQLHTIIQPSQQAITQKKTSYNFAYAYNPSGANSIRPHAPNHVDVHTYTYDLGMATRPAGRTIPTARGERSPGTTRTASRISLTTGRRRTTSTTTRASG